MTAFVHPSSKHSNTLLYTFPCSFTLIGLTTLHLHTLHTTLPFSTLLYTSTLHKNSKRKQHLYLISCYSQESFFLLAFLLQIHTWNRPMVPWTAVLTAGVQEMSNSARKWLETAIRASLGQRWNQFMVQPEISPGNFSDLLRNFSPTCRQMEITCIKFNIFFKVFTLFSVK